MKIQISRSVLADGLSKVVNAVPAKAAMPILSNVLMKTEGDSIRLTATDLELTITVTLPATILSEGSITFPAKRVMDWINCIKEGELEISVGENNEISLQYQMANITYFGLPAEEFPEIQALNNFTEITLPQQALKEGFKRTEYAISTELARRVLMGLYMSVSANELRMVATDGRRLAFAREVVEVEMKDVPSMSVILPANTVRKVMSMLDSNGDIVVKISPQRVSFEIGSLVVITKLLEGSYPNYEQVIPSKYNYRIEIPREEMMSCLNRISKALDSTSGSLVTLDFSDDLMRAKVRGTDSPEANEAISVSYKGDELKMGFNPAYLIAPLKVLNSETVTMDISNDTSPSVLRDGERFLYVLMPVKPQ